MTISPIDAQVLGGALQSIALEMGRRLARMSYSSIIRESEDFGAALLDAQGRQLAESTDSTPLQLGPIPGYLRGILRCLEERGEVIEEGDVLMHNSPYHGASHGPDIAFCVPAFVDGELIGYAVTTAHHLDVGALYPGSCGIVDAVDAYAEGLQFKAIKVYEAGRRVNPVWAILRDNVRAPDLVVGDMEAQVAAGRLGAERFAALVQREGRERVQAAGEALMDYSERMLRQRIAALPDGTYRAEGFIDGFIDSPRPEERDLRIAVALTVERRRHPRRPRGHLAAARPADQHAVRGHRRHRDLPDAPLHPARLRDHRARAAERGPDAADHHLRARSAAWPTRASRPRPSRASHPATSWRRPSCARSRRSCRSPSPPASATSR